MVTENELLFWWEITRATKKEKINLDVLKYGKVQWYGKILNDEVVVVDYDLSQTGKQTRYVIIGGSSRDKQEWLGNFKAYKTIDGIHNNYYDTGVEVLKVMENLRLNGPKLVFIGHSRGGAIAQVAAHLSDSKAITFGSPNPFKFKKLKSLNFEHILIRSTGDGVTRLPWRWLPGRFTRYSTTEIILGTHKGMEHTHYDILIKEYYEGEK